MFLFCSGVLVMSSEFWTMVKLGEDKFSGLSDVMVNVHLHSDQVELVHQDVWKLCTSVQDSPDEFGFWITGLFKLARRSQDSSVRKHCHKVWTIWNMIHNQIEIRLWLPYDTPSANESPFNWDEKGGG